MTMRIEPTSSTRHFCTDCTAMVVVTTIGKGRWVDPVEGGFCHGDLFCSACLSDVITGQRLCRGCHA